MRDDIVGLYYFMFDRIRYRYGLEMTDYRHEECDSAERFVEQMRPRSGLVDLLELLAVFVIGIGIYIVVAV